MFLITNEPIDATKNYNFRKFNKRRGFLKHLEFDEKLSTYTTMHEAMPWYVSLYISVRLTLLKHYRDFIRGNKSLCNSNSLPYINNLANALEKVVISEQRGISPLSIKSIGQSLRTGYTCSNPPNDD